MAWKCPNCETEIDHLQYNVNIQNSEYGDACLNDSRKTEEDKYYEIITEHEYQDSGDSEWDGSPEYRCPECDDNINPENLIWIGSEEEEKKKIPKEPEETLHGIVKPDNYIIDENTGRSTTRDAINNSLICKKCFHIIVHDIDEPMYGKKEQEFVECPNCGTVNSPEEFKELLKKGKFNKIKKHDRKKIKL